MKSARLSHQTLFQPTAGVGGRSGEQLLKDAGGGRGCHQISAIQRPKAVPPHLGHSYCRGCPSVSVFKLPFLFCRSAYGFSLLGPPTSKKYTKSPFCFKMGSPPIGLTSHPSWCRQTAWLAGLIMKMEKSIPLDVTRKQECQKAR